MKKLLTVLLCMLVPALALAQTVTTSTTAAVSPNPEDTFSLIALMATAFKNGDWMLGAGLLLTACIGLARLFGLTKLVPKQHTKWLAGGIAMLTSVSVGLMAHASWWQIISTGIGTGVIAVGGWEVIFEPVRNFLRKKLGSESAKKEPTNA